MKTNIVYEINENYIDLSQVKSFRLIKNYANDKEKKKIEIEYKERLHFVNGDREDIETISDKIYITFTNEPEAQKACNDLKEEWQNYIKEQNGII